ncbi:MAG TPA: methylenetetrahydrofolate reductase [NAD(P)H] [Gemmataceae bacterium]|nr:methylenetetrahydrofolate reductase [NAD(P)H] [Gemmataceae bacterium]
MRFPEFYAGATCPHISFEVFPPKNDAAMASLRRVVPELIELAPSYMTVTYGALGSTRERTLEIAALIKREYRMESACHLTCVGSSRADLDRLLDDIQRSGIENIVALRGDPPRGETAFVPPPDGYCHGNELVAHIRRRHADGFGLAVAGYPERHIESPDRESDLRHFTNKVNAGADIVITQLFYDNADFFSFVDAARALDVTKPIIPGLLPILSAKQVRRITSLCGSKIPPALQAELESAGDDDGRAEEVGIRQCVAQAIELLRRGVPGIHFYVLNKSSHMRRIMAQLRPVLAELRRKPAR